MQITRRTLIKGALGAAGAAGLGGIASGTAEASPRPPGTTTLDRTLVRGAAGPGGYTPLSEADGEPYLLRADLGVTTSAPAAAGRVLAAFTQLTDIHVVDVQSPARFEFFDAYGSLPIPGLSDFQSAYRPHELLSAQVAESMVQQVRSVRRGPATGRRLQFAIATGDNTDNCQFNELRWYVDVLDGRHIRPDSGDLTRFEGVMDDVAPDPYYWHPASGTGAPSATFGFPTVPGLLDAARRPFDATGLGMPWYSAYGNHDGLVQGNVPRSALFSQLAVGPLKLTSLPPSILTAPLTTQIQFLIGLLQQDQAAVQLELSEGGRRLVTPDPNRWIVDRTTTVAEHFHTSGTPRGHGFSRANVADGTAYYTFAVGAMRGIVLDTVTTAGGPNGSLDPAQLQWLEEQLQLVSRRWISPTGDVVEKPHHNDRLVAIFSHHTVDTMDNVAAGSALVSGAEVRDLLLRYPNVVLWVNGHTHRNQVLPFARAATAPIGGGFWEVNTAAHIDWPQQSRIVEVVDNLDGTLSVFGTILDHAAPVSHGTSLAGPLSLASLSREISANDWQDRTDARRGALEDRNVELVVPNPLS